jgi:Flp pilus assembly protein TadG
MRAAWAGNHSSNRILYICGPASRELRRMSNHIVRLFGAGRGPRRTLQQQTRRFGRNRDGATVVEFSIVIFPFLAIMFAIIEIGLVFFAGQVLETATADSARRIMTGEVQNSKMDVAAFKADVCARLQALFNCEAVYIDVKKYNTFSAAEIPQPVKDNELDVDGFGYEPGVQGDIVVVRVAYEWPIVVRDFGFNLSTLANGKRLLMATASFRNEPYRSN